MSRNEWGDDPPPHFGATVAWDEFRPALFWFIRPAAVQPGLKTSPVFSGISNLLKSPSFTIGTVFAVIIRDQHRANHRDRGILPCGPTMRQLGRNQTRTAPRLSMTVPPKTCCLGPIRTLRNSLRGHSPRHVALGGGQTPLRPFVAHVRAVRALRAPATSKARRPGSMGRRPPNRPRLSRPHRYSLAGRSNPSPSKHRSIGRVRRVSPSS